MFDATIAGPPAAESDPTLSTLVPRRSVRRNIVSATTALLLLVGAWESPHVLRPSVNSNASRGTWSALGPLHQALAVVSLDPDGWPYVGVQSVGDVPGADVAGTWVLSEATTDLAAGLRPADYATGLDYLRAALPNRDFGAASQLPQHLDSGKPAQLVILWNLLDCAQLHQDQRPEVELRTVIGTTTHQQLDEIASPGYNLDTLATSGACPTL